MLTRAPVAGYIIHWTADIHGRGHSLNNDLVYSLAVKGSVVYAGTELNGVFLSTDNGLNWSQLNDGLPGGITIYFLILIQQLCICRSFAEWRLQKTGFTITRYVESKALHSGIL